MKRLTLFAKGNLDVRDSLHSLRLGGELRWNGINTLARERALDVTFRVKHETSIGSAALRRASGDIPRVLADRKLPPLDPYPLAAQFGATVFAGEADATILSIQIDVQGAPARHRAESFLFNPEGWETWPRADRKWLRAEFEPGRLADPDEALDDLKAVVERLRAASDAPVLIYNLSSLVPGETVHCHTGMDDILSTRIKRFNLGLVDLSRRMDVSIIDVDRIVAMHGAAAMKADTTHLTEPGCRAVAAEVLRVLADRGCLGEAGAGE